MQKAKTFIMFGVWIAVLPYLGFPIFLKSILFTLTGLTLIYIGLSMRSKLPKTERVAQRQFENFSENKWVNRPVPPRPARQKLEEIKEKVTEFNSTI